jgi:DNA-binding transcriptional regulator YiaG
MYDIKDIEELVEALGGEHQLAAALEVGRNSVAMWKCRGLIPGGWHLRLLAMVKRKHLTVAPIVFGLTAAEAEGLFRA